MSAKKGGLGRGFDQLFLENSAEALSSAGSVNLPIGDVEPDADQPRHDFNEQALCELEESVRVHGILQPLLVRPVSDGAYRIVAGERRWRAARRVGLTTVPVIIRSFTDEEAAAIALIENLQREDLNAIEEAGGIKRLMEEFGFTQEQAAEKLSKSRPAIANSLRLLSLPEEITAFVRSGELSAGHARTLLGLNDTSELKEAAEKIIAEKLSVRETEALVKSLNRPLREKKPPAKRDRFYDEAELALSGSLARKVSIVNAKKGGKLEIEFFDIDDLKKLTKLFHED